jgi:prevent-host-death family protein
MGGMLQANLYEAKTRLSELVQAALDGEEVWIARAGKPLVRLVPGRPQPTLKGRGSLALASTDLDPAFTPEVDHAVVVLLGGDLQP